MNSQKQIAVYLRVSTQDQKTESQKREVMEYCKRRFPEADIMVFEDKASGSKADRVALERLLGDVRAGKVDIVACYKLDRLGRSLTHLVKIIDELGLLRIPLICTSQGIDTSDDNPAGRLQLNVLSAVAQFEREIIRERVNAGLANAKAKGQILGRPSILKKKKDRVMELSREGKGVREIGRELQMPPSSVHKLISQSKTQV